MSNRSYGNTGPTTMLHSMDGMDDTMMSMSFHFGYDETVLFDRWQVSTIGNLIGSMIGIFIIAFLYEGLRFLREYLQTKNAASQASQASPRMLTMGHLIQIVLHMIQVAISYMLMLIFMTYNVWLCIAVVAGAGAGYFAFGWRKTLLSDVTEHCH